MLILALYKLIVCLFNFFPHFLPSLLSSFLVLSFLHIYKDPFHFQAGGHRRRPNLAVVFFGLFYVVVYSVTNTCLLLLCFSFLVLSQEIGCEERLRNDLFSGMWDVKPQSNH